MAKKMESLLFDDGYESLAISDDLTQIIWFNPTNPGIINRMLGVQRHFKDYSPPEGIKLNPNRTSKSDMERDGTYVAEFSREMRKAFNGIFLPGVYDMIFASQSPLYIVGQRHLYERVLGGLLALMKPAVEECARKNQEKSRKYLEDTER